MKYIHKIMILASMLHPQTKANQWQALNQDYLLAPSLIAQKVITTPIQIDLYKQVLTKSNNKKEFTKLTYCYGNLFHNNIYTNTSKVRGDNYEALSSERLQRYVLNKPAIKANLPINHYSHLSSTYYTLAAIQKSSQMKSYNNYQFIG